MNESQRIRSYMLDLLSRRGEELPVTLDWLAAELRLASYDGTQARDETGTLEAAGLVASGLDGLGVRRWKITAKGRRMINEVPG